MYFGALARLPVLSLPARTGSAGPHPQPRAPCCPTNPCAPAAALAASTPLAASMRQPTPPHLLHAWFVKSILQKQIPPARTHRPRSQTPRRCPPPRPPPPLPLRPPLRRRPPRAPRPAAPRPDGTFGLCPAAAAQTGAASGLRGAQGGGGQRRPATRAPAYAHCSRQQG